MKADEIAPGVLRSVYPDTTSLSSAFVRIQEYYDGRIYPGKIFLLDDFIREWSSRFGEGKYDYPERWNGYNIPGKKFSAWLNLAGNELRNEEKELLAEINKLRCDRNWEDIYIFGISQSNSDDENQTVTRHELAHALFNSNKKYRKRCNSFVNELPADFLERAHNCLLKRGYARERLNDEIQAYLSTDDLQTGFLGVKTLNVKLKNLSSLERFAQNYKDALASGEIKMQLMN